MKKAIIFALIFVMLLSLCACGKKGGEETLAPVATNATEEVTIVVTEPSVELETEGVEIPTEKVEECEHAWEDATCTEPKTCAKCGDTEGEALGHSWSDGSCTEAKTCTNCGATDGKVTGHSWKDGACTECGATEKK